MDLERLDRLEEKLAKQVELKTDEMVNEEDQIVVPLREFSDVAKARNEQAKQENERFHWETELRKAQIEAQTAEARLSFEIDKLNREMELERERIANEAEMAKQRAEAEAEKAKIDSEASGVRSKRDLIGKILDFIGRVIVAVLGIAAAIYQANTIRREEENDTFVNSRSMSFWHKPGTKG